MAAGWPSDLTWVSFNDLWVANQHTISRSCDILYSVPNNSDQETQDLYDAIKQVAHETRVDHRFILAAVIQETKGCVRAKTSVSPDGIKNPGLLQSFRGSHSCSDENGKVQNPCPKDQILGMISDGGKTLLPSGIMLSILVRESKLTALSLQLVAHPMAMVSRRTSMPKATSMALTTPKHTTGLLDCTILVPLTTLETWARALPRIATPVTLRTD